MDIHSPALRLARLTLRILILLNGLVGVPIVAVLGASIIDGGWTLAALGFMPSSDAHGTITGLRAIATLGLVAIPLNHAVLRRLLVIVDTVRSGNPFVAENADRLQHIAWVLLALQVLAVVIGSIGEAVSTPARPLHLDAGFSTSGWLAVILIFVLARVFAEGASMRRDLDGTV